MDGGSFICSLVGPSRFPTFLHSLNSAGSSKCFQSCQLLTERHMVPGASLASIFINCLALVFSRFQRSRKKKHPALFPPLTYWRSYVHLRLILALSFSESGVIALRLPYPLHITLCSAIQLLVLYLSCLSL